MKKVMVFLQNSSEKKFIQMLLKKLGFQVYSLDKDYDLGDQVIETIPELIIASHFGNHKPSVDVVKKLRENKNVPKTILIRPPHEGLEQLPEDQRALVDDIVRSPIEPLKFIEVLSNVLKMDVSKLKQRYTNVYGSVATVGGAEAKANPSGDVIYVGDNEAKSRGYTDVLSKVTKPSNLDEGKLIQKLKREKLKAFEAKNKNENISQDNLKKEFVVKLFKK